MYEETEEFWQWLLETAAEQRRYREQDEFSAQYQDWERNQ